MAAPCSAIHRDLVVVPATPSQVKGAATCARAPFTARTRHGARRAGYGRASGPGGVALVFGVASLRPGGSVRTEAIQEHRMLLVDVGAAVVFLRRVLVLPRLGVLAGHAV